MRGTRRRGTGSRWKYGEGLETLESRLLLSGIQPLAAGLAAAAQLSLVSTSGSGASAVYSYQITLSNTGSTNIGSFWFSWVPGADFLPSAPLTAGNPAGWTHSITGTNTSTDGSAIEWTTASAPLMPGGSLASFTFSSHDSPAALAGHSPSHPAAPVETSFVYIGAPLADPGFMFTVTNAALTSGTSASTTTLISSLASANAGDSIGFTATVTPAVAGGPAPTGSVDFLLNGSSIGSATVQSDGTAILSTSSLPVGSDTITAQYGGDSTYSSSSSAGVVVTISAVRAPTTLTPVHPAKSYTFGQPIVLTTRLQSTGGVPTGVASLESGGVTLGTASLSPAGRSATARFSLADVAPGTYSATIDYAGDALRLGATSSAFTLVVNPAATTTALRAVPGSVVSGQSLTLTATIRSKPAAARTGTVTFSDGAVVLGTAPLDANDTATFVVSNPGVGRHRFSAAYSGDGNFKGSTSSPAVIRVRPDTTHVTLASSATSPIAVGQSFDLTAQVTVQSPGAGTPTGSVVFKDGGRVLGTIALDAGGSAVLTVSLSAAGHHRITAQYRGDLLDNPSLSPPLVLVVA